MIRVFIYLTTGLFSGSRAHDAAKVNYMLYGKDFNLESNIAGLPAASFVTEESEQTTRRTLDFYGLPYEIERA